MKKNVLLAIGGAFQGAVGTVLNIIGFAFMFPGTSPGERDYNEDMSLVPIGVIMVLVWLSITAYIIVTIRKDSKNLKAFLIPLVIAALATYIGLRIFL